MKIALISASVNSAVDQVMQDLKTGLARVRPDWVVEIWRHKDFKVSEIPFNNYDLVHFGYFGYWHKDFAKIAPPLTANAWHIRHDRMKDTAGFLTNIGFSRYFVDDVGTLQNLGQLGFTQVVPVPMAFDPSRWERLPPLTGPFTVGCFGDDFETKRFDVIQKACHEGEVEAYMLILSKDRATCSIEPREDVYSQIHAYAHASFLDTSCRPALEALACGIPVLSTINEGMRRIANGGNITFYDGSISDLARKIREVQEKYEWHLESAAYTQFPSLDGIALKYANAFESVVEEG